MRQIFLILAVLGAIISGWVPAVAATMNAVEPAGMHAMHRTAGEDSGSERGKPKTVVHPVACSACFAIEAARIEPRGRMLGISSRVSAAMPQLSGLALPPLDPPPRS